MRRLMGLLVCTILVTPGIDSEAAPVPTITAAVVEETPTAHLIRLVVYPPQDELQSKMICGHDSIRIRLPDIRAKSRKVDYIPVVKGGPLKFVRIVPRSGNGSVVQLFTRGRALAACARTTTMQRGGEIVISMSLTQTVQPPDRTEAAAPVATAKWSKGSAPAGRTDALATGKRDAPIAPVKSDSAAPVDEETKETPAKSGFLNLASNKKTAADPSNGKAVAEPGVMQYAWGFLFAGVVAAAAFWVKRRKQKKISMGGESIEILSSKRLGAHQRLLLAKVQGTKFLLAVGDKTVTTLGQVPEHGDQPVVPADEFQEAAVPADPLPANQFQTELERSLTQAVARAKAAAPPPTAPPVAAPPVAAPPTAAPKIDTLKQSNAAVPSNVSGLIAMARMRADLKQSRQYETTAEA